MTDPSRVLEHSAVARVRAKLADLDVAGQVVILDDAARTAVQAAEQLGIAVDQIANSLIFTSHAPDQDRPAPLLVLASGGHRVDTTALAARLGLTRLDRADAPTVREATGFAIGGVAPVGHPQPIRTVVDEALAAYDVVWAAAGHPHAVFPTSYPELLRITGGDAHPVAAD